MKSDYSKIELQMNGLRNVAHGGAKSTCEIFQLNYFVIAFFFLSLQKYLTFSKQYRWIVNTEVNK